MVEKKAKESKFENFVFRLENFMRGLRRWIKKSEKNGTSTQNAPPTEIFGFLISYNPKTTPPRVKILLSMDFLGSDYHIIRFSSRYSTFSDFDTLAFFLPILTKKEFGPEHPCRKKSGLNGPTQFPFLIHNRVSALKRFVISLIAKKYAHYHARQFEVRMQK